MKWEEQVCVQRVKGKVQGGPAQSGTSGPWRAPMGKQKLFWQIQKLFMLPNRPDYFQGPINQEDKCHFHHIRHLLTSLSQNCQLCRRSSKCFPISSFKMVETSASLCPKLWKPSVSRCKRVSVVWADTAIYQFTGIICVFVFSACNHGIMPMYCSLWVMTLCLIVSCTEAVRHSAAEIRNFQFGTSRRQQRRWRASACISGLIPLPQFFLPSAFPSLLPSNNAIRYPQRTSTGGGASRERKKGSPSLRVKTLSSTPGHPPAAQRALGARKPFWWSQRQFVRWPHWHEVGRRWIVTVLFSLRPPFPPFWSR